MRKILLFICFLVSTTTIWAQELDQAQINKDYSIYSYYGDGYYHTQTFTGGKSGAMYKISLFVAPSDNPMTLNLYETDANGLPILSKIIATTTGSYTAFDTPVDFIFSAPYYNLVANKKYAFGIKISSGSLVYSGTNYNSYNGGQVFKISYNTNAITSEPSLDMAFRTFIQRFELATTAASCNGAPNGSATVTPLFGTAPYTYAWSNGATTASLVNLEAGTYTVTVKDVNNLSYQQTVTISQPAAPKEVLSANATLQKGLTCDNTGTITLTDSKGLELFPTVYNSTAFTPGGDFSLKPTSFRFTPDEKGKKGYVVYNKTITQPAAFTAKFKLKGESSNGADGMSFNYGEINTATSDNYENGILQKDGNNKGKGLVVRFLTYNTDKIQIWYNGNQVGSDVNTTIEDGSFHNYEVKVDEEGKITIKKDNNQIFTQLALPNYAVNENYQVAFAGRTGGVSNEYSMDYLPSFVDDSKYQYSLDNINWLKAGENVLTAPAGQQKVYARVGTMVCGKLIGTYTVEGTPPPAAPTIVSPQTFSNGTKVSGLTLPSSPTGYYIALYQNSAGTQSAGQNSLLESKTYYARYISTDLMCMGLLAPIVVNIDNLPTIEKIAAVNVCNTDKAEVTVKLTDENVNALTLTAASSDENILLNSGLTITGTGATRILKITPSQNLNGIVTVKLTVKDANNTAVSDFAVRIVNESSVAQIKVFAGNGNANIVADNVAPTATHLVNPKYAAVDKTGNVFIGESKKVRRIDKATGKITTIATTTGSTEIKGVAVDKAGNVFYTDGAIINKLTNGAGTPVKYAGSNTGAQAVDYSSVANANIGAIEFMYIDAYDNIYVITDAGARVRLILPDANKTVRDVAGTGEAGFDPDGRLATSTKISGANGLTKDPAGNIYITFNTKVGIYGLYAVRKVAETTKRMSTVVSSPDYSRIGSPGYTQPSYVTTSINNCTAIEIDTDNNLYIAQDYGILFLGGNNYDTIMILPGSSEDSPYNYKGIAYDKSTDLFVLPAFASGSTELPVSEKVYRYFPAIDVNCNKVLPVTLTAFNAMAEMNGTRVEWQTTSEQNNSHFEVQRSTDGINFKSLGTVKANTNVGTNNRYSFYDVAPVNGVNYYRLAQFDIDGKNKLISNVKAVKFAIESAVSAKLYPNPARDIVTISLQNYRGSFIKVNVMDVLGKTIHLETIFTSESAQNYRLKLHNRLIPGNYYLKIVGDAYSTVLKLLVQ